MKRYILIIVILLSMYYLKAQDSQPDGLFLQMYKNSSTFTKQIDIADFQQKNFIMGWQWGGHPKLTEALKMNMNENHEPSWTIPIIPNNTNTPIQYIWQIRTFPYAPVPHLDGVAFIYKPTLNFDANMNVVNSTDPDRNIFGFRTNTTSNIINQNRLELDKDSVYINPVLQKPWSNDRYCLIDQNDGKGSNHSTNGQHFIITVNLRRKDFTNNSKDPNTPVLSITLPYTLVNNSYIQDSIKFDGFPDVNNRISMSYTYTTPDNYVHTNNRGYCYGLTSGASKTFTIYENMLPDFNDSLTGIGPDITISASFTCSGTVTSFNPYFKSDTIRKINSLDMNVYYKGNCSVLLNYIRVSNVEGDNLFKGYYDSTYQSVIQTGITRLHDANYDLFRFYLMDEIGLNQFFVPQYEFWSASRYYNRLVGGLVTTENTPVDPRFAYHVGLTDGIWTGFGGNYPLSAGAPYFSCEYSTKSSDSYKMMNLGTDGYRGAKYLYSYDSVLKKDIYTLNPNFYDTLNSSYETRLYDWQKSSWIDLLKTQANDTTNVMGYYRYHSSILNTSNQVQTAIDMDAYNYLYANSHFLYSNKPWWTYFLPNSRWHLNRIDPTKALADTSNYYLSIYQSNPITGEMMRYCQWRALVLGSKGFTYDAQNMQIKSKYDQVQDPTQAQYVASAVGFAGWTYDSTYLAFMNNHTANDLIYSDNSIAGCDFEPTQNQYDYDGLNEWVRWNESCTFMGIQPERFYVGRKSPRVIMLQTHYFIQETDQQLMRLRLTAWYGKGFRVWQNADTANYSDTIMKRFIKVLDSAYVANPAYKNATDDVKWKHTLPADGFVKTRPIGRMTSYINGINQYPLKVNYYEPWDSSFVDLTLLKDTTASLDSIFFIGLVNRRTDPLVRPIIYRGDTIDSKGKTVHVYDSSMMFYSTAEIFICLQ